jgi:peptide deformylase
LKGQPFELKDSGYIPRIWQHEMDHLNGTLITDRMGPTARMEARKKLKELEDRWAADHPETKPKKSK